MARPTSQDELEPQELLKPVSKFGSFVSGAVFLGVGAAAALVGTLSLIRSDYALGWGVTMIVLGAPAAVVGVQLLLPHRWPLRPTAPWALFAFALFLVAMGLAMVWIDKAWAAAETCWAGALAIGYVAWRRHRKDAA